MNIPGLTSNPSVRAALLAAQAGGASAQPTAAQLEQDRKTLQASNAAAAQPTGARPVTPADVKKAASQFEAIIIRQLLEPSISPIMSGGLGGAQGSGGGIYGYMLTDVLANSFSQGGGLGWAKLLEKQLSSNPSGADNENNALSDSNLNLPTL